MPDATFPRRRLAPTRGLDGARDGECFRDILASLVVFSLTGHGCVEGEADEFDGGEFVNAREHGFALVSILLDVKLPAENLAGRCVGDDLFRGHGCVVGDDLHGAERGARGCDAGFAVRVCEAGHGSWGDVDGETEFVAEGGGGEVAAGAVDKDARTEQDGAVDFIVEAFGDEVVGGGVVVGPCFAVDLLCGDGFDLVDVEEGVEWRGAWTLFRCDLCFVRRGFREGLWVDGA